MFFVIMAAYFIYHQLRTDGQAIGKKKAELQNDSFKERKIETNNKKEKK